MAETSSALADAPFAGNVLSRAEEFAREGFVLPGEDPAQALAHVLRQAGRDVQMGGNIGTAVLALEPPAANRIHVISLYVVGALGVTCVALLAARETGKSALEE